MHRTGKQKGFSLTEVLIATAILAIGLIMIAMAFPVGVKLTSIATERTIGAVAANEAFAKFQLYSRDPDGAGPFTAIDCDKLIPSAGDLIYQVNLPEISSLMPTSFLVTLYNPVSGIDNRHELWYPSVVPIEEQKYHWTILARRTDVNELQLTAFVTRIMDGAGGYYDMVGAQATPFLGWPVPVIVGVSVNLADANEIRVTTPPPINYGIVPNPPGPPIIDVLVFFTEGCTIVDDMTGEIYRVIEILDNDAVAGKETLVLNRAYSGGGAVWVVPPAVGSTRNPCIAVQQRIIRF